MVSSPGDIIAKKTIIAFRGLNREANAMNGYNPTIKMFGL
jgi:hypothetical protein